MLVRENDEISPIYPDKNLLEESCKNTYNDASLELFCILLQYIEVEVTLY